MNLKKKMKGFFTLTRKADGGFTLVELIVVIAILAILAGVAVPAYSGYVTQTNKAADQQLVRDVAYAMELHYYSDPTKMGDGGYVVLKASGAEADEVGEAAMEKVFGSKWAETTALKYDGWTDDGLLAEVLGYSDAELELIANSSFLTNSNAKGMMNAVSGLTNLVGDVINTKSPTADKSRANLVKIFGEDSDIVKQLDALQADGLKEKDYPTAISNMLVNFMADSIESGSSMSAMMNMYAQAFAYAEKTGDTSALEKMNENLKGVSMGTLCGEDESGVAVEDAYAMGNDTMVAGMFDENGEPYADYAGFIGHLDTIGEKLETDNEALANMMGAVQKISGNYMNIKDVTNAELFSSGAVAAQVNTYLSAVKALASVGDARTALEQMEDGNVALFVTADGVVVAVPGAAWLASGK